MKLGRWSKGFETIAHGHKHATYTKCRCPKGWSLSHYIHTILHLPCVPTTLFTKHAPTTSAPPSDRAPMPPIPTCLFNILHLNRCPTSQHYSNGSFRFRFGPSLSQASGTVAWRGGVRCEPLNFTTMARLDGSCGMLVENTISLMMLRENAFAIWSIIKPTSSMRKREFMEHTDGQKEDRP